MEAEVGTTMEVAVAGVIIALRRKLGCRNAWELRGFR